MSGFDANTIHAVPVLRPDPSSSSGPSGGLSASELSSLLHEFIMEFRVGGDFIYRYVHVRRVIWRVSYFGTFRDQLRANVILKQYLLDVDLRHISLFQEEVGHAVQGHPGMIMPLVNTVIDKLLKLLSTPLV